MLGGAGGTAVLKALSGETLRVIAGGELIAVAEVPIALAEVHILVKGTVVVVDAWREVIHRRRLSSVYRSWQRDQDGVAGDRSLSVIIEEEEQLVLLYRTADVSAELVEVIPRLDRQSLARVLRERSLQAVDGIVCVQSTVAEELERRSVIGVRSRFGNHVDDGAARAPQFGGIAVRVYLEFLHRVFAELVRSAA